MSYELRWEEQGAYCLFSGKVSGEDLRQCDMDIYGDPRFDEIRYQILDLLAASELDITPHDIKIVASCDKVAAISNPKVRCALVSTDPVAHELFALYQQEIKDSPWDGKSFHTVEEAREWVKS